jgi:predicted RNase H-like HicB family nuclease
MSLKYQSCLAVFLKGATRDEAQKNVTEASATYLESLAAHGEPIPPSILEEVVEITL